jgi:DNA-directed RNA polymerase specialized sigma24 family protein
MDLKSKQQRLRNGVIAQDKKVTQEIISLTIKKIEPKMEQLIKHLGGTINSEELINSFVVEQFVIFREQLMLNSIPETDDITQGFLNGFLSNIALYTFLVSNPKHQPDPSLWLIAFEGLKPDFNLLLNRDMDVEITLNSFLVQQHKRFISHLIHEPFQFADFTPNRFYGFARKNLFYCEPIYQIIGEKSVEFVLVNFYQKMWYNNEKDLMRGIVEDLADASVIDFYTKISRKTIENPLGLLRTICSNKVIDHYKKSKVSGKNEDDGEKERSRENEALTSKPNSPTEVSYAHIKGEPSEGNNIIASIDLAKIKEDIVAGCPNKRHIVLMRLHLEGFAYSEIADSTEFGEKSAKSIVCNIKAKIRRYVGRNYFLDN